jgi:hypothetical protein
LQKRFRPVSGWRRSHSSLKRNADRRVQAATSDRVAFRLVLAKARGTGNLSGWINVVSVRIDVGADGKVAGLF